MKKEFNKSQSDNQNAAPECPISAALFDLVDRFAADESCIDHRLRQNKSAYAFYQGQAGHWGSDLAAGLGSIMEIYEKMGQSEAPSPPPFRWMLIQSEHVLKSLNLALKGEIGPYSFINQNFVYDDSILPGLKKDIEIYPIGEVSGRVKARILGGLLINAEILRLLDKKISTEKIAPDEMKVVFDTAKNIQKINAHLCDFIDVPKIIRRELGSLSPLGKPIKPGILMGRYFTKVKAFNEADEPPKIDTTKDQREKGYHEWPIGFPYF